MSSLIHVKLVEISISKGWKVVVEESYAEYINGRFEGLNQIVEFTEKAQFQKMYRWYTEIGSIQYFVGVFPEEKTLRMASKNLKKELRSLDLKVKLSEDYVEHIQKLSHLPLENAPSLIEFISVTNDLPNFSEEKFKSICDDADKLMVRLADQVSLYKQTWFEKLSDKGLDLVANFMLIRVHLLKYLAILPNLDHDKDGDEVKRLLLETFSRLIEDSNKAMEKGIKGQKRALPKSLLIGCQMARALFKLLPASLLAKFVRFSVSMMAKRFIAGENIQVAKIALQELQSSKRSATIDQLGELVVSKEEADDYCNKVLTIIEGLKNSGGDEQKNEAGIFLAHVSIKVSALAHDFRYQDFEYSFRQIYPRLEKILLKAKENNVFINIDAEHFSYRNMVFDIYAKTLSDNGDLIHFVQTGIVVQAYLRDALEHLEDIIKFCKRRGVRMPIRLVKGAYWDAETIEAEAHNFISPQFLNKDETDLHYRQLVFKILSAKDELQLTVASHNIQDHCFARCLREKMFADSPAIEHQCLHMTYEGLSTALAKMGWPTRNYIPLGNLLVGMAYLVRRIMENSSQVGVLTMMRSHKKGVRYQCAYTKIQDSLKQYNYQYDASIAQLSSHFKNIYPIRTYQKEHLSLVQEKLEKYLDDLKIKKVFFDEGSESITCSSNPDLILGKISFDSQMEVDKKINILFNSYMKNDWKFVREKRLYCFIRLIDVLLQEREQLAALIMLEAGKTIDEAIADVDEAIDFVDFYLANYLLIPSDILPKGVVGVIAPWNFPLAIACGMSIAPLICGNSVILKPAEQTPLIAKKFIELCYKAGIPEDVLQVAIGDGHIGKAIVDHELTVGVVFTGSRAVGTEIYKKLSTSFISEKYEYETMIPKFAVTEMGGKNAIIVTNNCELDETISGVIYSAFAHAGQKCSAASRVIIDNNIRAVFENRFKSAVEDLQVGPSYIHSTLINPLITKEDQIRVKEMALKSKEEISKFGGCVLVDRSSEQYPGHCVGPSVFSISSHLDKYTMIKTEVFGPIVHIIGYNTLDEAIKIFNSTEYALTGGVYCQSQDDLDYLLPQLKAGNLYVNRPNTGARVGIEPFGGFKMSGTGPKAGGKEYLDVFVRGEGFTRSSTYEVRNADLFTNFDKRRRSKRVLKDRIKMVQEIVGKVLLEKEVLFQGVGQRLILATESFIQQIEQGRFDLENLEVPNHYIPGQLSFNKKNLGLGNGIIIDSSEKISISLYLDFLVNIIVGNGLNIICTSEKAYSNWKELTNLSYSCGLSIYNVSVNKFNKDELLKVLNTYSFKFIVFSKETLDEDIIKEYINKEQMDFLPKCYIDQDGIEVDKRVDRFTYTRSMAINTMRHGAPLELTL